MLSGDKYVHLHFKYIFSIVYIITFIMLIFSMANEGCHQGGTDIAAPPQAMKGGGE